MLKSEVTLIYSHSRLDLLDFPPDNISLSRRSKDREALRRLYLPPLWIHRAVSDLSNSAYDYTGGNLNPSRTYANINNGLRTPLHGRSCEWRSRFSFCQRISPRDQCRPAPEAEESPRRKEEEV
jgi:hypothetical protein